MGSALRWGEASGADSRVLDSIDFLLEAQQGAASVERTRMVLCRLGVDLARATAAGHVRYDAPAGTARLCLWRGSADREAQEPVLLAQLEPSAENGPHDWWLVSRSRRVVYEWLGEPHLAELPLSPDPASPSLLVIGRPLPFTDEDSDRLAASHRALVTVERLMERLLAPSAERRTHQSVVGREIAPRLTSRELEVLQLLSEGMLARSIATRLKVSERTVHRHLGNLYRKLDAHDRLLAVRRASALGLLPEEPQPGQRPAASSPRGGATW